MDNDDFSIDDILGAGDESASSIVKGVEQEMQQTNDLPVNEPTEQLTLPGVDPVAPTPQPNTQPVPGTPPVDPAPTDTATKPTLHPLKDGTFADGNGNIVDENGAIIAKGGYAARIFQERERLQTRLRETNESLQNVVKQFEGVRDLASMISNAGLETQDVHQAMEMASRIKRGDVLGVAKELVAFATARGHNVSEITGNTVGDAIEMKGLQRMLDERLAPLRQQEELQRQQEAHNARAIQQANSFLAANDFAEVHVNEIATIVRQQDVTPQQAYNQLRSAAVANGFNFALPLGPQIEFRRQQAAMQQSQQQLQQTQKPRLQGNSRLGGGQSAQPMAAATDSWDSILLQAGLTKE